VAQFQPENGVPFGAQRDADVDLMRTLARRIANHAIDPSASVSNSKEAKITTIRSNTLPSCMLSRIEVTLKGAGQG
jgi:hypothetical protein